MSFILIQKNVFMDWLKSWSKVSYRKISFSFLWFILNVYIESWNKMLAKSEIIVRSKINIDRKQNCIDMLFNIHTSFWKLNTNMKFKSLSFHIITDVIRKLYPRPLLILYSFPLLLLLNIISFKWKWKKNPSFSHYINIKYSCQSLKLLTFFKTRTWTNNEMKWRQHYIWPKAWLSKLGTWFLLSEANSGKGYSQKML